MNEAVKTHIKLLKARELVAKQPTLTARVRAAMQHLAVGPISDPRREWFTVWSIDHLMPGETYRRLRGVINQFIKSGEIRRVKMGHYEYVGKKPRRTKLDVIWHLVRSHRQFETDQIERLSGATRGTVLEYLHCLRRLGFIRQPRRGYWQLIEDPGPDTPVNAAKCKRLRALRVRDC